MKAKRLFKVLAWPLMAVLLTGLVLASCKDTKSGKTEAADNEETEEMEEAELRDNPDAYFEEMKTVKVKTAREFLQALKSNRHIVITESDDLDLTAAINDLIDDGEIGQYYWGDGSTRTDAGVFYAEEYDGNTINIQKLHDIFIEGTGSDGADLRVTPRYADVLRFDNCRNIAIRNVTMGHYEAGSCTGDVLVLNKCKNVLVDKCRIFGCGVDGLTTNYSKDIDVKNSHIYGCSDRGITMQGTNNINFDKCKIYDNDCGALYCDEGCEKVTFTKCKIYDNRGGLFFCMSEVKMKNCEIEHHHGADLDNVRTINCEVDIDNSQGAEY